MSVSILQPRVPRLRTSSQTLFGDHVNVSGSLRDYREYVEDMHRAGMTGLVLGVNSVVGKGTKLLTPLESLYDFASVLREAGKELSLSWWVRADTREQCFDLQDSVSERLNGGGEGLLAWNLDDLEGHFFNGHNGARIMQGMDVKRAIFRQLSRNSLGVRLGVTTFGRWMPQLAKYFDAYDLLLLQSMKFEDEGRGMGLTVPTNLPGFGSEEDVDRVLETVWKAWKHKTVPMGALYKQDFGKVSKEDAIGAWASSFQAGGWESLAWFSKVHLDAEPSLEVETAKRGPVLAPLTWSTSPPPAQPTSQVSGKNWAGLLEFAPESSRIELRGVDALTMVERLKSVWESKGYKWFDQGNYNLNLFGIRGDARELGVLDDHIGLAYKVSGVWRVDLYAASVEPGPYYERNPVAMAKRFGGVAILMDGQYPSYALGRHFGYPAVVQSRGKVIVARDNNVNGKADMTVVRKPGRFGINLHPVAKANLKAGDAFKRGSAGCQVLSSLDDHNKRFLPVVRQGVKAWGNSLTYTLVSMSDLRAV